MVQVDKQIHSLLEKAVRVGASDLHLSVGASPTLRVNGKLVAFPNTEPMTAAALREAFYELTDEAQRSQFQQQKELDFSQSFPGLSRFRVNAALQRGTVTLAFRILPTELPTPQSIGLPAVVAEIAAAPYGLLLITGATGSGKTTTLAALVNHLNQNYTLRILCIEDPIEYLHPHQRSSVVQRELGTDTHSFAAALRHGLRQDPDVMVVGELRDRESISIAMNASETGHTVLGTLHSGNVVEAVERIVTTYPVEERDAVLFQLSSVLLGITNQGLLPHLDGKGRVAFFEILRGTQAVRNIIREQRLDQIRSYMQIGRQQGMQTCEQCLADMVNTGLIGEEIALTRSAHPQELKGLLHPSYEVVSQERMLSLSVDFLFEEIVHSALLLRAVLQNYIYELVSEVFSMTNIVLLKAHNLVTDLSVTIIRPVNLRLLRLS